MAYSAAQFASDAKREMAEITGSNKVPLLVGGTMLYFKVLLEGLVQLPEANPEIRDEIQKQADLEGWSSLHRELEKLIHKLPVAYTSITLNVFSAPLRFIE